MDGPVMTGSVHTADWRGVCAELLEKVLEMIFEGRIEMGWLRRNFGGLSEDSTEVHREPTTQLCHWTLGLFFCSGLSNRNICRRPRAFICPCKLEI
ncbi:hypothetical protein PVK06_001170 [Gossypium arboreum]|uniref:Uncharacterized protein n=1 Tax=Gossypium arboreum TaxID=29729 RepID=A0ABR0R1N6_GOSAR|nr:hypothetical protein PVK06_001170 [Gossypium arboreum]